MNWESRSFPAAPSDGSSRISIIGRFSQSSCTINVDTRYDPGTVKRTVGIHALCGMAAALLIAPAAHAQEPVSDAVLSASPGAPTAGAVVRLAAPAGATSYAWDFDGDGTWDADGPKAEHDHSYDAGVYGVTVRLTQPDGTEQVMKLALDVAPSVTGQDVDLEPADDTAPPAAAGPAA